MKKQNPKLLLLFFKMNKNQVEEIKLQDVENPDKYIGQLFDKCLWKDERTKNQLKTEILESIKSVRPSKMKYGKSKVKKKGLEVRKVQKIKSPTNQNFS